MSDKIGKARKDPPERLKGGVAEGGVALTNGENQIYLGGKHVKPFVVHSSSELDKYIVSK